MICKSCGTEVADGTSFCPQCGQSLSATCPRCKAAVKDGSKFCPHCGMPLDGSTVCSACGAVVPVGEEFCPKCGMGADGRRKCPHCGAISEVTARFCSECGNTLSSAKGGKTERPDRGNGDGGLKEFVYQLIRRWVTVGALIAIFIVSFFGMLRIPTEALGIDVKVHITGTDLASGMFRLIDPPTEKEAEKKFDEYVQKHPSLTLDPVKCMQRYGVLHYTITQDFRKNPDAVLSVVFWGLLQWGIWGVTLAFLILETIRAIQYSVYKTAKPSHGARAFGLTLALPLCYTLAGTSLAGCAVAMMIISACCLAGMIVCRYAVERQPFSLLSTLRQSIGLVFAVVVISIMAAAVINIRFGYINAAGEQMTVNGSLVMDTIFSQMQKAEISSAAPRDYLLQLVESFEQLSFLDDDWPEFLQPIIALLPSAKASAALFLEAALPPYALALFTSSSSYVGGFQTMGYLTYFCMLGFTAMAAVIISMQATALADGKKSSHLAFDGVLAALSIAIMVFVIVTTAMGNSIASQVITQSEVLSGVTLRYTLAAMPIVSVVFTMLNLIQSIVFTVLNKKSVGKPQQA